MTTDMAPFAQNRRARQLFPAKTRMGALEAFSKGAAPGIPDSIHHRGSSQLQNRAHVILRRTVLQCPAPRAHELRLVHVSDLDSEHGKGQVPVTVFDSAVSAVRAARGRPLAIESHWLSPECALALLMHYRDLSVVQWYGPAAAFAGRTIVLGFFSATLTIYVHLLRPGALLTLARLQAAPQYRADPLNTLRSCVDN